MAKIGKRVKRTRKDDWEWVMWNSTVNVLAGGGVQASAVGDSDNWDWGVNVDDSLGGKR